MFNKYHHHINNYDNKVYNFEAILHDHYSLIYSNFNKFNNIHHLLNTNNLTNIDKEFYNELPIFGSTDRDSIFVKNFYDLFDTNYMFLRTYLNFINDIIKPLFPNERYLCVQKTPNIRFHLPNNTNIGKRHNDISGCIGIHTDNDAGHPMHEINIIIPITEMYSTNSIYYEDMPNSIEKITSYNSIKLLKNQYYIGNLNQCKHYNKINDTGNTRVSLDFRVIPMSKYQYKDMVNDYDKSITSGIKFRIGNYYMII